MRRRRWAWLLALHLVIPAIYYLKRRPFAEVSEQFYNANILALNWLGEATGLGYVGISLVIGVVVPILIYGVLSWVPKRWVFGGYVGIMAGNLGGCIANFRGKLVESSKLSTSWFNKAKICNAPIWVGIFGWRGFEKR